MIYNASTDLLGGLPLIPCPRPDNWHIQSPLNGLFGPQIDPSIYYGNGTTGTGGGGSGGIITSPDNSNLPRPIIPGVHNPTISVTFAVFALLSITAFLLITFKYGNVRIFGRRLKMNLISNKYWIWYFLLTAGYAAIECTRYVQNLPYFIYSIDLVITRPRQPSHNETQNADMSSLLLYNLIGFDGALLLKGNENGNGTTTIVPPRTSEQWRNLDAGLLLTSTILRLLSLFVLVLALNWQLLYRSGMLPFRETFHADSSSSYHHNRNRTPASSVFGGFAGRLFSNGYGGVDFEDDDEEDDNEIDDRDVSSDIFPDTSSSESDADGVDESTALMPGSFGSTGILNKPNRRSSLNIRIPTRHRELNRRHRSRKKKPFCGFMFQKYKSTFLFRYDRLAGILTALTLFFLYVHMTPSIPYPEGFFYLYLGLFASLHLVIMAVGLHIIFFPFFNKSSSQQQQTSHDDGANYFYESIINSPTYANDSLLSSDGPSAMTRLVLLLALILNLVNLVPPSIVSLGLHCLSGGLTDGETGAPFTPKSYAYFAYIGDHNSPLMKCYPFIPPSSQNDPDTSASTYFAFAMTDVVTWVSLLSLMLMFAFVRWEFRRVKKKSVWWTVRMVTGTFGFSNVTGQ